MGVGGDLPPPRPDPQVTDGESGLEPARALPAWRRVVAALAGGFVFFLSTLVPGVLWWAFRHVIGKPRPFGRIVFHYGRVGVIAALGILGADELAG